MSKFYSRKWRCLLTLLALFVASLQLSWAQGLEDFSQLPNIRAYNSGSFVGNNSITWNYGKARGDVLLNGKAFCSGKTTCPLEAKGIPNGVGKLSFQYKKAYSSNSKLSVFINDQLIETIDVTNSDAATYSKDVNVEGTFSIKLVTTQRTAIDDIEWTAFGGSTPQNPELSLSVSKSETEEGSAESIDVTASLSQVQEEDVTVELVVSGEGISADDFSLSATQFTIPAGEKSASVTLTVKDDSEDEGTETMMLALSNPSEGIELGEQASRTLRIVDNDNTSTTVEFQSTSITKTEDAGTFDVVLNLVNPSSTPTVVNITLPATNDITSYSQSVTFEANATSANMTIEINDDELKEAREQFVFTLSSVSGGYNAKLGDNTSFTLSITDNDGTPATGILANYQYLQPETNAEGKIIVNMTPKEYVQTVTESQHMNSVRIPEEYYSDAVGLTGTALRDQIHTIISTGAKRHSYDMVWTMCENADENPKNHSQVWQMYVEEGIGKSSHVSGSTGWNREHTWAKSHGDFGVSAGAGTDGHHLRATDARENSTRGSRDFANTTPGYTPPKSARGDVARMIFYMATRWEMTVDNQVKSKESNPRHGKLDDLLKWHEEDPVDPYEVRRNNVIFGYQHNRNPFIDHPELVQYIFGEAKDKVWDGGVGTTPSKIKIAGSLSDFGVVMYGKGSNVQNFTISGSDLSENVTLSAPQHFQLAKDGVTFSSSLNLEIVEGKLAETTIFVKFIPESAVGAELTGKIEIQSREETKSISVSGTEGDPSMIPVVIYQEDYNSSASDWIMYSASSNQDWHYSTSNDRMQGKNSSVGMAMNNYSGDTDSEDWLISPELELSSIQNANVVYWLNSLYSGSSIEVLYSNNYSGSGDPRSAQWTSVEKMSSLPREWTEKTINLSSVSENIYIAFKHISGKGKGGSSALAIDDFQLTGIAVPLNGTLSCSKQNLEFDYTEEGNYSTSQTYELSFEKLEGDITVAASENYQLSLDGMSWESELNIAKSATSPQSIQVRYSPQISALQGSQGAISHKAKGAASVKMSLSSAMSPDLADANSLGKDQTLDIVSWNVEWFGAPSKSKHASSFDQQLSSVSSKIIELDADVYALQELVSDDLNGDYMAPLVAKLNELAGQEKYVGVVGPRYSHDSNPPSAEFPAQRVCYIYNKNTVKNLVDFSMFNDLYQGSTTSSIEGYTGDASKFWASGRLPYMLDADVTIDGVTENIKFVNIHGKCCSNSHARKLADAKFLLNELNTIYAEDNLVILGDYNDFISGSMSSGMESPYASWFTNKDHFDHVLTSSTKIDHITISNELYDEYGLLLNSTSETNVSVSDHKPIMLRLKLHSYKSSIVAEDAEELNFDYIDVNNGGGASAAKTYTVKGEDLTGDVLVNVTQPFQLSLDGNNWSTSITIEKVAAASQEVKIRLNPETAYVETINGSIRHQSEGAKTLLIPVKAYGKPDHDAPEFANGYPQIGNFDSSSFELKVKLNEAGKIYYAVFSDEAAVPTVQAVKEGTDAIVAGSFDIDLAEVVKRVEKLSPNTHYDVYIVAEDDNEPMANTMESAVKLEVKTSQHILLPYEYVTTVTRGQHFDSSNIPANYYLKAKGSKGEELKDKIAEIINENFVSYPYEEPGRGDVDPATRRFVMGTTPVDVYDIMDEADRDPNNPTQVYMIYKECTYDAAAKHIGRTGSQEKWNREHVYPQSLGGFKNARAPWGSGSYANGSIIENAGNNLALAQSDAHHLRSSDKMENNKRSNYPFATSTSGSKYEPPLSAKGDVARIIFYLNVRYGLDISKVGSLGMFLEWNEIDPVDPYEVRRNNVVYKYQKNRNPFVDCPELVQYIYGAKTNENWNKVQKQAQTITFEKLSDKTYGAEAFDLKATASSGLEVSFKLVSGPAKLEGNTLSITGLGTVTVKAIQEGNETYLAAEEVTRSFEVSKASQTITFAELADKTFGDEAFDLSATATSGLTVGFEVVSGPATVDGNSLSVTGAGTVKVKAIQEGNKNYLAAEAVTRSFEVSKATQTITFAELSDKILGDEPIVLTASASSGLEVSFQLVSGPATLEGNILSVTGVGVVTVKAIQEGNKNYLAAEVVTRSFEKGKFTQTIKFAELADKTFGDESFALTATASSDLAVNFEVVSGPAALDGNILSVTGVGVVTVKAIQEGNESYLAAEEVTRSFEVEKADQTISFDSIADQIMGEAPIQLVASSTSGLQVEFEILLGEGKIEGSILTLSTAGEFKIRAFSEGSENYNSAESFQTFSVQQATGIKEIFEEQLKMYPNPATTYVNLELPGSEVKQIKLLNAHGQVLKSFETYEKLKLNVQNLPSGYYFITIQTDQFVTTKRLMIVNH
ncbi:MAG: endonuclease [Marinifilaceae bacterium]